MSATIAPTPGAGELAKPGFAAEALPHLDSVYRFALRLTRGRADEAEDLVQETFLRAYRAWESYRPGTNCRSWLFTICRNAFLRQRERAESRPETPGSQLEVPLEELSATPVFADSRGADPERAFFDSFVDGEVLAAIDALPLEFREVVVLSDLHELPYAEIAETLAIPIGTVRSRLHRGRKALQERLYEYAVEEGYVRPRPGREAEHRAPAPPVRPASPRAGRRDARRAAA